MGTKLSKSIKSQSSSGLNNNNHIPCDDSDHADIPIMAVNFSFQDLAYEDTSAQAGTDGQPLSAERDDDEALLLTNPKPKYSFKITILGEMQTGKTALANKIAKNIFSTKYRSTSDANYYEKKITKLDCLLQFIDIAGQERYGSTSNLRGNLKEVKAIILTYKVTNRTTFNEVSSWLQIVNHAFNQDDKPQVYIAGTMTDLPDKDETIINDAIDYAKGLNVSHHLISNKTSEGVDELINQIANDLVKLEPLDQPSNLQGTDQQFTQQFFAQRRKDQPLGKAILAGLFKYGMYGDIVWHETFGIGSLPTTRKEINDHLQTTRGKNSTSAKTYQTVANLPEFSN